jgi:hypothetical protein
MQADIDRVVDVNSSPAVRNAAHADVMARAVAGQRIEKGLQAVTNETERDALRDRIDNLRADPNLQHGDREILEFVHELSDTRQPESSREFLRGIQELKGAPLDETLRVHKGIYREAFQPARDPNEPVALADWKETRAKDMEKVNAELTSIALHVAQANRLGTLDTQLAAAFPQVAGAAVPAERAADQAELRGIVYGARQPPAGPGGHRAGQVERQARQVHPGQRCGHPRHRRPTAVPAGVVRKRPGPQPGHEEAAGERIQRRQLRPGGAAGQCARASEEPADGHPRRPQPPARPYQPPEDVSGRRDQPDHPARRGIVDRPSERHGRRPRRPRWSATCS